jgi:hypothetical protein
MSSWRPQNDLARLLEALANEIVTTTELELRAAYGWDERAVRATAKEISRMILGDRIDLDDLVDPDKTIVLVEPTKSRGPAHKQH